MRTLVKAQKDLTSGATGALTTTIEWLLIDVGDTCVQDRATYNALAPSAKDALPAVQPANLANKKWVLRSCDGTAETQPTVITPAPDVPFLTAGTQTITIPKANYAGGNLVFTATTGTASVLEGGITLAIVGSNIVLTIPDTATAEWYIVHLVATNSVGSVEDAFSVHLTYNASPLSIELSYTDFVADTTTTGGGVTIPDPVPGDPAGYGIISTFIY